MVDFSCATCGRDGFARQRDLKYLKPPSSSYSLSLTPHSKHEKTHTRPHKCLQRDCQSPGFATRRDLNRHVNQVHSRSETFYCPYEDCYRGQSLSGSKPFLRKDHLKRHIAGEHGTKAPVKTSPLRSLEVEMTVPLAETLVLGEVFDGISYSFTTPSSYQPESPLLGEEDAPESSSHLPVSSDLSSDTISLDEAAPKSLTTQLCAAIRDGDDRLVGSLLFAGANPHAIIEDEDFHSEDLEYLEDMLEDQNFIDGSRVPLICWAARRATIGSMSLLLQYKANPNMETWASASPLVIAIWKGDRELVQVLIKAGADTIISGKQILVPVIEAAHCQEEAIVKDLFSAGAVPDVDVKDRRGFTVLMGACRNDSIELVNILLQSGARCDIQDRRGETALMKACRNSSIETVELLLQSGARWDIQDKSGMTALMRACMFGSVESVKILLQSGARCDVQDEEGGTALMWACENRSVEAFKILLQSGARWDIQDKSGRTALMRACMFGSVESVKILLQSGARYDTQNEEGGTALHYAIVTLDITKELLNAGADINCKNYKGETPLHKGVTTYWISEEDVRIVDLLLRRGASVNAITKGGQTPLDIVLGRREDASRYRDYGRLAMWEQILANVITHGGKTAEELGVVIE